MCNEAKVVINLATGLEDPERVTVAFLVGGAAAEQGKRVAMFLTKEAVRLAVPGVAAVVACDGCPPLGQLFQQFADKGGELLVCPICVKSRKIPEDFVANARLAGATPLWEWIGEEAATVFSY
jgi:predicted peroxiredoxin